MFQSIRASQLALRIGLALTFLWFGVHAFVDPQYWIQAWIPASIRDAAAGTAVSPRDLANLVGIFAILTAASLATGYFMRAFAIAAIMFLLVAAVVRGPSEMLARDTALIGALVALFLWPERSYV